MAMQTTRRTLSAHRLAGATGVALLLLAGGAVAAEKVTYFRIGTGATGGTYFPIGTIIANAISRPPAAAPCDRGGSCGVEGLIAVAQTTHGSVQNVKAIAEGALESGLVQADIAWWAWKGEAQFRKAGPSKQLRVIANLYRERIHLVVQRDSKIRTIADLRGRRVSLGEKDSGTLVHARILLRTFGLSMRSVKPAYMTPSQAAQALGDGKIDGFFLVAGYPAGSIRTLAERMPIRLVEINGRRAAGLAKRFPFFAAAEFPDNAYKGTAGVATLSVGAQWLVAAGVDEKLVYGITKALWHKRTMALLAKGHPQGKRIRLSQALEGVSLPLHPGAARFYREAGMIKPDGTPTKSKGPGGKTPDKKTEKKSEKTAPDAPAKPKTN
jgi:TRAP transporter TAXI family solute receptor